MPGKRYIRNFLSLALIILLRSCSFGQGSKADSLLSSLDKPVHDTVKVRLMNRLALEYNNSGDYEKAMAMAESAMALGEKYSSEEHTEGEKRVMACEWGFSFCNAGIIFRNKGNFPMALENYFKGMKIFEEQEKKYPADTEIKKRIASALNNIGNIYSNQMEYQKALENYGRALQISQDLNDPTGIAKGMNNTGVIYNNLGKFKEAKQQFLGSLKIKQDLMERTRVNGNPTDIRDGEKGIAFAYNNIGNVYMREGEAALGLGRLDSIGDKFGMALHYYLEALEIRKKVNDVKGLAISMGNIGDVLAFESDSALGRGNKNAALLFSRKALHFHLQAFTLAKEKGLADVERDASQSISNEYDKLHLPDSVLKYYRLFISLRDTLLNKENTRKSVETEMNFAFDKKLAIDKAEQEKKNEITRAEARRKNIVLAFTGGGLLLVILFFLFLFNRFRVIQKQKEIIEKQKLLVEEKQKEVFDSIHYAKKIQQSLLPPEKYVAKTLDRLRK